MYNAPCLGHPGARAGLPSCLWGLRQDSCRPVSRALSVLLCLLVCGISTLDPLPLLGARVIRTPGLAVSASRRHPRNWGLTGSLSKEGHLASEGVARRTHLEWESLGRMCTPDGTNQGFFSVSLMQQRQETNKCFLGT